MMECDDVHQPGPLDIVFSKHQDQWLTATREVKRLVIGSNQKKADVIEHGILPRLLEWMRDESVPQELRTEAAVVLGSLAWGTQANIKGIVQTGAVPILLRGLSSSNLPYVEACLRCLRTIFTASDPPVLLVYEDRTIIPHLLKIIHQSVCTKECVANILAYCCTSKEHQDFLCEMDAISYMAPLLAEKTLYKIQMPVLKFFAALCYQNPQVCSQVVKATVGDMTVPQLIGKLQSRDKTSEMQMAAAKCLTFLHRGGAILASDKLICLETLPTLVRMCKKDRTLGENVEGAETLAYLILEDQELQRTASICDHSMKALADYLTYTDIQKIDTRQAQKDVNWGNALRAAAFSAFAAIGANDEQIRNKIIAIDKLVEHVVTGMKNDDEKVKIAACRCLHSLSRSVQLIRTTFKDHDIWKPVLELMQSQPDIVLKTVSPILCNLLLEFSSSKEAIMEHGGVEILLQLCKRQDEPLLRMNGVWGLMNLVFNSDQGVKVQVLDVLRPELLMSLMSEDNADILLRTLGLLRNLMTRKHQIDNVMTAFGTGILEKLIEILGKNFSVEVKEQAVCVMAHIADGGASKDTLMNHSDSMNKLIYLLQLEQDSGDTRLQVAAVCVMSNLITGDDEKVFERIKCLRELGVQQLLQKLVHSTDIIMQERAKQTLRLFP